MKMTRITKVAAAAWRIRRYAPQMVLRDRAISAVPGLCRCAGNRKFSHAMRSTVRKAEWEGRDRFLLSLSHGYYAIAYYAALLEAGIIPKRSAGNLRPDDSRLPMSGDGDLHAVNGDDVRWFVGQGCPLP